MILIRKAPAPVMLSRLLANVKKQGITSPRQAFEQLKGGDKRSVREALLKEP